MCVALVGLATAVPATAAPVTSAAVTSQTSCGGGFSVVSVRRSTTLNPLTASSEQLLANNLPSAPTDPTTRAAWQRFVTSPIEDLTSCSDFLLAPTQPTTPAPAPAAGSFQASAALPSNGSYNWAGNIAQGGSWSAAQATWNVPAITGGGSTSASAQWVGVNTGNGTTADPLYQAGTWLSPAEGYKVFTEVFPQQTVQVQRYPSLGDAIQVRVTETSTGATFDVADLTAHWSFELKWAGVSHVDGHGEAIDERPGLGNYTPTLHRQYAMQNTYFQGVQVYSTTTGWVSMGNASHYYLDMFACNNTTVLAATQPMMYGTDYQVQGRSPGVQEAC